MDESPVVAEPVRVLAPGGDQAHQGVDVDVDGRGNALLEGGVPVLFDGEEDAFAAVDLAWRGGCLPAASNFFFVDLCFAISKNANLMK